MEQKKSVSQKMSALIAAVVVAGVLAAVAAVTVLTLANNQKPTLSFEGVTLRPVVIRSGGQSIETVQALVNVYVTDVDKLTSVQFRLNYNKEYLVPSDYATNEAIASNSTKKDFYGIPDTLYGGKNPYDPITVTNASTIGMSYVDSKDIQLLLMLQEMAVEDAEQWPEEGFIHKLEYTEESAGGESEEDEEGTIEGSGSGGRKVSLYIDATEKTHVATLSFQVRPEKLDDMMKLFSGKGSKEGSIDGNYFVSLDTTGMQPPGLLFWNITQSGIPKKENFTTIPGHNSAGKVISTRFDWTIPNRAVTLHSNEPDVTINAYQAYTGGTVTDIVDAIQKYSPTARALYSTGREEDILLHWGGGEGCIITEKDGTQHLFRWTTDINGEYDGGYELQQWDAAAGAWIPDDGGWYDPTHYDPTLSDPIRGTYTVSQYVDYSGVGGPQRYEYPVSVTLNVTPVKLTDVTAADLHKTYTSDVAKTMDYDSLKLPDEALLTTDVVCGSGSLMMSIDDWTPRYTNDMSEITGVGPDGTTAVTWLNEEKNAQVGVYTFTADPVFTGEVIQAVYPWLTVTEDHPLKATRQIVAAEDFTDGELFRVSGKSVEYDNGSCPLELQVLKRNEGDSDYLSMVEGTTFRIKLPNGVEIDQEKWFKNSGSYTKELRSITIGSDTVQGYTITITPGSTTGAYAAERELLRRYINLGGYFSVAVTEPKTDDNGSVLSPLVYKAESDFIPTYIAPRKNVYLSNHSFDFTGDKSSLLPLYRDRTLPTTVVLPYGSDYSVATRYDGVTGAEPGKIHTVVVDTWATISATAGDGSIVTWNGSAWTGAAPIKVQYGQDPFARSALITGYGEVVNPNEDKFNKQVEIMMQVLDEDAPVQDLRLTYEETGASVSTLSNGEVDRVTFDPRSVGYTDTQRVTLTLTNTGTTDIRGIYLDTSAKDGTFRVIDPPATELPAGASTTFTLTYKLGLGKGEYRADETTTTLKVYSSTGMQKEFKAYLEVTDDPLWRVRVRSTDDKMGAGRLVAGVTGGVFDDAGGPNIYREGNTVWVLAEPKGEYAVSSAYYYNKKGEKVTLTEYSSVVTDDGKVLYSFTMPAQNVIVYVAFEEPVKAKLRLELLEVDAGPKDSTLTWKLPLRRADNYEIVQSSADEKPDLSAENYLVIIPAEDEFTQIKVTLRDILQTDNVFADVNIVLNYEGSEATSVQVYDYKHTSADMKPKLKHNTAAFASPRAGHYVLATITITAQDGDTTVTRTYTVKIARRPNEANPAKYPLSPGNSPYGMIEGDATITDKAAAKAAYDAADCFAEDHTPVRATDLTNTYWPEAWGDVNYDKDPDALFVYLGEAFDDGGPEEVRNTARDKIVLKDVDRSAEVTLLDGTKVTLDMGTADVVTVDGWWKDASANAYAIRPGVYAITYSFTDADGATLSFQRPLILLSRNGDVNVSGAADNDDAAMVEKRFSSAFGYGDMFLYRVCDANNDRNLNNVDANAIRGGKCVNYYLPTSYSDVTAAKHTAPQP